VLAGDIMKGLTVFDVREIRNQVELWEGPSSPQSNIWVNDIVILSPSRYLVCDKERNLIVFERKLKPVTELETFKLQVVAQVSAGEEVTAAVLGTMSVHAGVPPEQKSDNTKEKALKRREKKQESKEDVDMLAELEQLDSLTKMRLDKVNPTQDFIRQLCGIALAQLKDMQSQ
jgi:antitoxin (DNA-binding transcriptional repressor) of toxin-antitoxin stability system